MQTWFGPNFCSFWAHSPQVVVSNSGMAHTECKNPAPTKPLHISGCLFPDKENRWETLDGKLHSNTVRQGRKLNLPNPRYVKLTFYQKVS